MTRREFGRFIKTTWGSKLQEISVGQSILVALPLYLLYKLMNCKKRRRRSGLAGLSELPGL